MTRRPRGPPPTSVARASRRWTARWISPTPTAPTTATEPRPRSYGERHRPERDHSGRAPGWVFGDVVELECGHWSDHDSGTDSDRAPRHLHLSPAGEDPGPHSHEPVETLQGADDLDAVPATGQRHQGRETGNAGTSSHADLLHRQRDLDADAPIPHPCRGGVVEGVTVSKAVEGARRRTTRSLDEPDPASCACIGDDDGGDPARCRHVGGQDDRDGLARIHGGVVGGQWRAHRPGRGRHGKGRVSRRSCLPHVDVVRADEDGAGKKDHDTQGDLTGGRIPGRRAATGRRRPTVAALK